MDTGNVGNIRAAGSKSIKFARSCGLVRIENIRYNDRDSEIYLGNNFVSQIHMEKRKLRG